MKTYNWEGVNPDGYFLDGSAGMPRSEERFSRNAETDLVCRLLLEKKKGSGTTQSSCPRTNAGNPSNGAKRDAGSTEARPTGRSVRSTAQSYISQRCDLHG